MKITERLRQGEEQRDGDKENNGELATRKTTRNDYKENNGEMATFKNNREMETRKKWKDGDKENREMATRKQRRVGNKKINGEMATWLIMERWRH